VKLGFSGTEEHFPILWNYKAHESSRAYLDGETGRKLTLEKLRIKNFVPTASDICIHIDLWASPNLCHYLDPLDLHFYFRGQLAPRG
jgi:hypothetical protein